MKSFRKTITLRTRQKYAYVNVTSDVQKAIDESGVKEGLCLVNSMHITSSIFINDDESGLHQDFAKWLEQLAPHDPSPTAYAHHRTGEDNADAHLKRQIMKKASLEERPM